MKFVVSEIYYAKVNNVSNFYLVASPDANSNIINITFQKLLSLISNNGSVYFKTTYSVTTGLTLEFSGKTVNFIRSFTGEMFNVTSAGTLQIGSKTTSGYIVFEGNSLLGEFSLIKNAGTLKIYGNVVIQNAFNVNGTAGQGGAINSTGIADLDFTQISGCRSLNTSSLGYGGAIYNSGTMNIANLKISNCLSTQGGAIYNSGTLNMTNCNLNENKGWFFTANILGCSIYTGVTNSSLKMTNCKISNSYAVIYDATTAVGTTVNVYGGGIYVGANASVEIVNSTISTCTAKNGGGIYVIAGAIFMGSNIVIQNCVSNSSGSALYSENANNVTLNGFMLVGNSNSSGTILSGIDGLFSSTGSFTLSGGNLSLETDIVTDETSKTSAFLGVILAVLGVLAVGFVVICRVKNAKRKR
ncbi:MAG: hypothetical protein EOM05_11170 [Clostridia bacterium]|nr:hypothetical protein [Clostridia bacterium]